jgi:DNA-binding MarR family transcriptional regulator
MVGVTRPNRSALREADAGLAEALFTAMGVLRRQVRREAGRPWQLESLTGSQRELVRLVRHQPGISVAQAAAELGLAANSVSTLVRQLTEAGMIRRAPDPDDRRVARLSLTRAAQRHLETWRDRRTALAAAALGELSAEERATLARALPVLDKVSDSLRASTS